MNAFNRRKFLQTAALGLSPLILPGKIWSAEKSPNDQITLGFIGMGKQARGLLSGFLKVPEVRVLAVCEVDATRREHAKKTVDDFYAKQNAGGATGKDCAAYRDFRDLLGRRDIDGVVIATPDHWHALIAIEAARAGKDIYCEKPLCQSIREARMMVRAVRQNKRVFQVGSQQRSSKEFRHACELIRNGRIGRIERIEVAIGGPGVPCDLNEQSPPAGLDWDLWLGPAPKRGWNEVLSPIGIHDHFPNWRKYREFGGGMVTDWGAHHFDIVQWALGMDESGPVEILPAKEANAQQGVRFRYANGVEVEHKSGNGITFFGSAGKIFVNRGKFEITPKELDQEPIPSNGVKLYVSEDHRKDWLNSMRSRKAPICDVEVGARSVTVCHLVNLVYYHGQPLKWDPKREQFVGGTGNSSWLDVPHRDPWTLPAV